MLQHHIVAQATLQEKSLANCGNFVKLIGMRKKTGREKAFIATRKHHLTESAEDYTELISDLISSQKEARTCEIARHMGISHVTAIRTLKRLQKEGYIETAPHQPVTLTAKGKRLAAMAKKRHLILLDFLIHLGVPKHIASIDAEGMEHHISSETLEIFQTYIK
jgi:DtxR family manganese transport transcriptional regulator